MTEIFSYASCQMLPNIRIVFLDNRCYQSYGVYQNERQLKYFKKVSAGRAILGIDNFRRLLNVNTQLFVNTIQRF